MSDDAVVQDEGSRTRLLLLVGGGLIAALALILFVVLPLLTNEPEVTVDDTDVVVVDGSEEPRPEPSEDFDLAEPGSGGGGAPPETFEVFSARDPFQQLVRDGDGTGGTGTGGPTPVDPTDPNDPTDPTAPVDPGTGVVPPPPTDPNAPTVPGDPTASPSPAPPPGDGTGTDDGDGTGSSNGDGSGTGSGNGDDGSANVGGTTVTLVDVFTGDDGERKATITVNGTGYTVGEGATFGSRFRLLDISGSCSTMLFGDSRFTLCEGERIRK